MKRDPKRIDKMINRLRAVWKTHPDLRLGQLVSNATRGRDIFYIEDDVLIKELELYPESLWPLGFYGGLTQFMKPK